MKTFIRFAGLLFAIISVSSQYMVVKGQSCYVVKDSVISGSGAGSFTDYILDPSGRIAQAYYTDSGSITGPWQAVVVLFDAGSQLPIEYRFANTTGTPTVTQILRYTRDGNGRITSVFDSSGQATTTHTVSYNGSGNISSIILSSSTGNPDFPASFTNFVWQNGNITSVNLDLGGNIVELIVKTDSKNNIRKKLLHTDGVSDLFLSETLNNVDSVVLVNQEILPNDQGGFDTIPAGSLALINIYTYNSNDDVETVTELPSAFNRDGSKTTKYFYDCSLGISITQATSISIYPNPANDIISLENGNFQGVVRIFDVTGKIIRTEIAQGLSSLNVSELVPGIYYIEIADGKDTYKGSILKK